MVQLTEIISTNRGESKVEKQSDFQAYVTALWEIPLSRLLTLLDLVGLYLLWRMVIDDLKELAYVLAFLAVMLGSNYLIFKKQREIIGDRENRIAELEATEANIHLKVAETGFWPAGTSTLRPFPEVKVDSYGFDESGLPGWGVIWASLEGENVGWEAGKLIWEFDRDKTELPRLFDPDFALNEEVSDRLFWSGSRGIEGRTPFKAHLEIGVRIAKQKRQVFARALNSLKRYRVVINYYTKSIVGESKPNVLQLSIEGDFQEFRQKILDHWKHSKHCDLAQLAESQ